MLLLTSIINTFWELDNRTILTNVIFLIFCVVGLALHALFMDVLHRHHWLGQSYSHYHLQVFSFLHITTFMAHAAAIVAAYFGSEPVGKICGALSRTSVGTEVLLGGLIVLYLTLRIPFRRTMRSLVHPIALAVIIVLCAVYAAGKFFIIFKNEATIFSPTLMVFQSDSVNSNENWALLDFKTDQILMIVDVVLAAVFFAATALVLSSTGHPKPFTPDVSLAFYIAVSVVVLALTTAGGLLVDPKADSLYFLQLAALLRIVLSPFWLYVFCADVREMVSGYWYAYRSTRGSIVTTVDFSQYL